MNSNRHRITIERITTTDGAVTGAPLLADEVTILGRLPHHLKHGWTMNDKGDFICLVDPEVPALIDAGMIALIAAEEAARG